MGLLQHEEDHAVTIYVGHLAQLRLQPAVTIDVSNQLWHDMIGCGAEARDLRVTRQSNIIPLKAYKMLNVIIRDIMANLIRPFKNTVKGPERKRTHVCGFDPQE